jgi:hypothetical protein
MSEQEMFARMLLFVFWVAGCGACNVEARFSNGDSIRFPGWYDTITGNKAPGVVIEWR